MGEIQPRLVPKSGSKFDPEYVSTYWLDTDLSRFSNSKRKIEKFNSKMVFSKKASGLTRRHDLIEKLRNYDIVIEISRSQMEEYARVSGNSVHAEFFSSQSQGKISLFFSKVRFTNLTTGLAGAFFVVLMSAILIGVVSWFKGSAGLAEGALYALGIAFVVGIVVSDRIESEFHAHRG